MLDINLIRENPDIVRKALTDRQDSPAPVDGILKLDEQRRALLIEVEALKAERNAVSKEIGKMKDAQERQVKVEAMRIVGDKIAALDKEVADVDARLKALVDIIPNIPDARLNRTLQGPWEAAAPEAQQRHAEAEAAVAAEAAAAGQAQ